jgi:small subunit ribosomal protein S6
MNAPRKYELVYIVSPEATEEQVAAVHEQIEQTVQKMDGTIDKTDNWGRRKLAYEIGHHKEGVYVLEVIFGSGELMRELERRLKVMDEVIRQLIVRVDEDERIIGRRVAERKEQRQQRRIARGLPPEEEESQESASDDDQASGGEKQEGAEA